MNSVCMAVYNGSAYIEQQIRSILCQLSAEDEVILVDDKSTDRTLDVVNEIADKRITVYTNEINMGVIATVERAIKHASGDIVFLSDQDDIWYSGKVNQVSHVFETQPDVTLVVSDARIIDGSGRVVAESFYEKRGAFVSGMLQNIVKNKYLGCTMAFKRSFAEKFLPFPQDIPMHDIWIGIINAIYGRSYFIKSPLIGYRRHQNNTSPYRQGFKQILVWRWRLIKNIVVRVTGLG